jgi:hypothetical protein
VLWLACWPFETEAGEADVEAGSGDMTFAAASLPCGR